MALSKLTSSDAGAGVRDKINAIIDAIGVLGGQIDAVNQSRLSDQQSLFQQIVSEGDARVKGIAQEAKTRGDAIAAEQQARTNAFDSLQADSATRLVAALLAVVQGTHPGSSPLAFTTSLLGLIGDTAPFDTAGVITTSFGAAYRVLGAGQIAARATVPVDPDTAWVFRARYWRLVDVIDPNNNAVDIGIQWLNAQGGDAGKTLVRREINLRVQDGPQMVTARVPSLVDEALTITPPAGAVSWRPYVQAYGADGALAVGVLGASDATFAGVYAPDVYDLMSRLGTIEGQISAGLPFAAPISPSYLVADLPEPGNRGRKAFAMDGRAPNAAGALEPANGGTGVEVTDNGTAWVITGTNQQVQA